MLTKQKNSNYQSYLFNFSSSYQGGGLKRLTAFVKWFDRYGGANFIINKKLRGYFKKYTKNRYFYENISLFSKFINRQKYVDHIISKMTNCNFYYSYNIPINRKVATIDWFHLSNVLPFTGMSNSNLPLRRKLELWWLGILIRRSLKKPNYVSAESNNSVKILISLGTKRPVLSINGADDELKYLQLKNKVSYLENQAVIVGTYYHKNLADSYKIYKYLQSSKKNMKLIIIGSQKEIPSCIKNDLSVILKNSLCHRDVIKQLSSSKYYINTSLIENSWNGVAEGVTFAKKSYISSIPTHLELLKKTNVKILKNLDLSIPVICVSRSSLDTSKIKSWDKVIGDMNFKINKI